MGIHLHYLLKVVGNTRVAVVAVVDTTGVLHTVVGNNPAAAADVADGIVGHSPLLLPLQQEEVEAAVGLRLWQILVLRLKFDNSLGVDVAGAGMAEVVRVSGELAAWNKTDRSDIPGEGVQLQLERELGVEGPQ